MPSLLPFAPATYTAYTARLAAVHAVAYAVIACRPPRRQHRTKNQSKKIIFHPNGCLENPIGVAAIDPIDCCRACHRHYRRLPPDCCHRACRGTPAIDPQTTRQRRGTKKTVLKNTYFIPPHSFPDNRLDDGTPDNTVNPSLETHGDGTTDGDGKTHRKNHIFIPKHSPSDTPLDDGDTISTSPQRQHHACRSSRRATMPRQPKSPLKSTARKKLKYLFDILDFI